MADGSNGAFGPDWALQSAVIAALEADAALAALLGEGRRIFDAPPRRAPYPAIAIARVESLPYEAALSEGLEQRLTLHVYSRAARREAMAIIARLRAVLHHQPIAIAGRRLVLAAVVYADVVRNADLSGFLGLVRLRALTELV